MTVIMMIMVVTFLANHKGQHAFSKYVVYLLIKCGCVHRRRAKGRVEKV